MISPYKIRWNDYNSDEFYGSDSMHLITSLSFDGDSGETETFLGREAVMSETYNGALKRTSSYKWSESMSPSITIMKNDFSDFTLEENRKVLTWLTGKKTPGFLDVKTKSNTILYSILGNFVSVSQSKLGNSRIVGYVAQFESLMPYALSGVLGDTDVYQVYLIDEKTNTVKNKFIITINTDEPEEPVYPRITIKHTGDVVVPVNKMDVSANVLNVYDLIDGTIYKNLSDNQYYYKSYDDDGKIIAKITDSNSITGDTKTSVVIKNICKDSSGNTHTYKLILANNSANEVVVVDGANKVISSWYYQKDEKGDTTSVLNQNNGRVFGNDFNWEWLPLYNGVNEIEVIGNCEVIFEYREVRKIGEMGSL